jgi:hypothetical protein
MVVSVDSACDRRIAGRTHEGFVQSASQTEVAWESPSITVPSSLMVRPLAKSMTVTRDEKENPIVSVPVRAFVSSTAARKVQVAVEVSQRPSPALASPSSPAFVTVNVAAMAATGRRRTAKSTNIGRFMSTLQK